MPATVAAAAAGDMLYVGFCSTGVYAKKDGKKDDIGRQLVYHIWNVLQFLRFSIVR